jgi:hypothetical protein
MAKNISYLDNLKKELIQKGQAGSKFSEAKYKANYGVMGVKDPAYSKAANKAAKSNDKAWGQVFGALLQGRRYDDNTGKQIKKSTAPAKPMTGIAKPVKKAAAKKK